MMALSINETNIRKTLQEGDRLDDRDFDEYREITIEPNYVHETADGSAMVEFGDTKLLVGISTEIGDPYPDQPDKGALITNVELNPMAGPEFESGPPGIEAVELSRLVDRGIRESGMIDMEQLGIESGEKCWMVYIDVHVIDFDGDLVDAASLGAVTALELAKLPALDEDGNPDRDEYQGELPTTCLPITATGSKIAGELLFDTTADEEEVRDARLTVSFLEDGNVVSMQKGEAESFDKAEVMELLETAQDKSQMLRRKVEQALEEA